MFIKKLQSTIFLLAALQITVAESREMYRYTNDQGNTVIDYQVPPKYVAGGYQVINEDGVVLREVGRRLTNDELENQSAEQRAALEAEAAAERQRKRDESLLLRYSSIEDIESARERALRDVRIRVSILKGNNSSFREQVERYQAEAANTERSGREVSVEQLNQIEELQAEIRTIDRGIDERNREMDAIAAEYQSDIDRFTELLDLVEMRRSMHSGNKPRN